MSENKYSVWSGRFRKEISPAMHSFNRSFDFDRRLYRADIRCSQAYAKALHRAGVISLNDDRRIQKGLKIIEKEFEENRFAALPGDEDIHMAVERRLVELIGSPGQKLASGRSRNDQVATDERLYLRETIETVSMMIVRLQVTLINRAAAEQKTVLPGYTHMQQAQPVLLAHYLLSFFFALERDKNRFADCRNRLNFLPLGAGAFAGNPFCVDQAWLAGELGFDGVENNSIDAVSDRDAIAEFLNACTILSVHLSRYAEDFIIWSTREFAFIEMDDAYTTGSSLMPQKKNPDALELIRGKTGRVLGHYAGFITTMKGLPLTYAMDLQEDKEPLFDAVDTIQACLNIFAEMMETVSFNRETMRDKIDPSILATDLADYLVKKGTPFRESHHIIGSLIREAADRKESLDRLPLSQFKKYSDLFENDVFGVFNPRTSTDRRKGIGGTAGSSVRTQLRQARQIVKRSQNPGGKKSSR